LNASGSCHCQAVRFSVELYAPCPYLRCYCSICRKVAGGGGYAIDLGGHVRTLVVQGAEHLGVYDAASGQPGTAAGRGRRFCTRCASALWNFDPAWPELVHPFASCIDSELPSAPAHVHIMLGSKASWVPLAGAPGDELCDTYPEQSLAQWHARQGLSENSD
jgi:hypothetical protein